MDNFAALRRLFVQYDRLDNAGQRNEMLAREYADSLNHMITVMNEGHTDENAILRAASLISNRNKNNDKANIRATQCANIRATIVSTMNRKD